MTKKTKKTRQPKYFAGLHAHSTFSIGDGIGRPEDHINFARKNGMDALALTDHGNMNGFSHQYLYGKELKKQGVDFKAIPGIEAYFVPSLHDWKNTYDAHRAKLENDKIEKKREAWRKKMKKTVGDSLLEAKDELQTIQAVKEVDEETQGDSGVENETASKENKFKNPLYQRNHLVLLPKNQAGLQSLFACVSHSFKDGFYRYPRMDFDLLGKQGKGNIIALSACVGGYPSRIIYDNQPEGVGWDDWVPNDHNFEKIQSELGECVGRFQEALGEENYYLELQFNKLGAQHLTNMHLIECAKRTGAPLVVTCDSHYSEPDHWKEREIYRAMSMLQLMKKDAKEVADALPQSVEDLKCELYPKNAEQVWQSYVDTTQDYDFYDDDQICDAIERSHDIAHDQLDDIDFDTGVKLPSLGKIIDRPAAVSLVKDFGKDAGEDVFAFEQLKRDVIAGAKWRKVEKKQEYIDRLKVELEVVKKLNFAKYFLTYAKIMGLVENKMLIGNARGSAGGSLLSYVLNITQLDPIKHGLLFERFLTPTKKGFPDIDSDFGDRETAVADLTKFFGQENVIPVSNFNQLQLRSLIKDVSRLNGVPFDKTNAYTKKIETEARNEAKKKDGYDAAVWQFTYEEAEANSPTFRDLMEEYPGMDKTIKVLFKNMRNVSRHAGGVIITDNGLGSMPVIKSGGVLQTPWQEGLNYRHLEGFGFLKFDILGLGTLRMFENCIRRILKKQGNKYPTFDDVKQFYYNELHPDNNPMTDPKVYKDVYWNKKYTGVFQFVQDNVQTFMSKLKPKSVLDIAIATSIFRPGPLGIKADRLYLQNRKNPDAIQYQHPLLKEVLEPTSGLIVFQEQLQLIYHKLAGVPLNDTDAIRKAFMKKDIANKDKAEKERQRLRKDFIIRCEEANDVDPMISGEVFDDMEKFVAYSFNKSHAMAYAITSYQCAHFLTYYPDEWVATYIDYCATEKGKVSGKEDPKAVALGEARGLGYSIGKPDINESSLEYDVIDGKLIPSFSALKSVGTAAYSEIKRFRPYKTLEELLWNPDDTWRHSKFNKRAMEALVKLEALDTMDLVGEGKQFKNYRQLHNVIIENADGLKRACARKKKGNKEMLATLIEEAQSLPDWEDHEKISFCKELTGTVDMDMIVTPEIRDYFKQAGIQSLDQWTNPKDIYWAVVQRSVVATTKKTGKKYCRINIYGDSGQTQTCFLWNYNPARDNNLPENSLILAKFKKTDFGLSSFFGSIEVLEKKKND